MSERGADKVFTGKGRLRSFPAGYATQEKPLVSRRYSIHGVVPYRSPISKIDETPVYLQRNNYSLLGFRIYSQVAKYMDQIKLSEDTEFRLYCVKATEGKWAGLLDGPAYALIFAPVIDEESRGFLYVHANVKDDTPSKTGQVEYDTGHLRFNSIPGTVCEGESQYLRFPDPILFTDYFMRPKKYKDKLYLLPPIHYLLPYGDDPGLTERDRRIISRHPELVVSRLPYVCFYGTYWIVFIRTWSP